MIPHIHHEVLPRENINTIIENSSTGKVVCLVGPFGFGKTLAVVSWLTGRQAAWLNIDDSLNNEEMFLKALENELNKRGDNEKILVIDNFHLVKSLELLRHIKNFIYENLGQQRIVIISREGLQPIFNDLILRKHICLITIKELNFSCREIADYFAMNRCDISEDDVIKLKNDTEGWPAALNVTLVLSRNKSVAYKETAWPYIMGFFETEIWSDLDDTIKDFLLKTSVLSKLSPSSCNAVTDIGITSLILNVLFQNGLFISKLDELYTYQYHRVFQDFLTEKLKNSDIDEKYLYKKAAWWLYERDEIPQAFTYFFKAKDLYGINQTLKKINPSDIGMENFLKLIDCITELKLPELRPAELKQYPIIVARMAFVEYLKGNISKMQSLYYNFEEWLEPGVLSVSPEEYAEYVWEAGWLCYLDPNESMGVNKKHLRWANYSEYVPHLKKLHLSRAAVLRFPSVLRGIRDYADGVLIVEGILLQAEKCGFKDFPEEHSIWETYLLLAEYKYELEDFDRSEEIVQRIMGLTEARGYTDLYFICVALMVKLLRATNRIDKIDRLSEQLEKMIIRNHHYFLIPNFHAFQMRNQMARTWDGFSDEFMKENQEYKYKTYIYLLYRHFTLARGLMLTGVYNEAMMILGNIELVCHKYFRATDLIEVNILKAIGLYGLKQEEGACRHLMKALEMSHKYKYIRMFADEAEALWPILDMVRKEMSGSYVKNVISSCKKILAKKGYRFNNRIYTHIKLTKAEIKILKALQTGLSYEEIAFANNIKMSTVKTHAHSIYSKLGVDNRTSAIIAAQECGFIEGRNL